MNENRSFITGSYYEGIYNTTTNNMEYYGRYTFPDGSTYLGYFHRGVFHGSGIFELSAPYKIKFKVIFDLGRLVNVEKFVFPDGLCFKRNIKKCGVALNDWAYLTRSNRLYPSELLTGAQPVGPNSLLTLTEDPEIIPDEKIDAGEGFYNPQSRFIVDRKTPLVHNRFVCDPKEVKWIEKQCRVSDDLELVLPDEEDCEKILRLNRRELAIINSEYECPCEADKKPMTRVKHEDEHSWSTISPSSICDEDVRISDIMSKSKFRQFMSKFSVMDVSSHSLIDQLM
ncbi:MORN repeat-containing protein 5-like [Teleopsis dalmanni]|uniref:MORN repeat-containing protein 5-like n=1 Tax=Teleopsis dalmanni TaxID=139649 RepID=UPI0018CE1DB2|nr:MORN repeat-containing protein 5-like [Teleopsis dalmanni]